MTANVLKEEKDKYLSSGFNAVITKPFRRDELINTMSSLNEKTAKKNVDESLLESYSGQQIMDLAGGDRQFLKEMLETFSGNISKVIQIFWNSIGSNDSKSIKYNCHQIKPSLKLLNLNVSYEIASEIENRIEIGASVSEIESELNALIDLLEKALVQVNYDLKNKL